MTSMWKDARAKTGSIAQLDLIKINQFTCLFIYLAHAGFCVRVYVHAFMLSIWKPGVKAGSLPLLFYVAAWRKSHTGPEAGQLSRLADQLDTEDPLASISQHWACSCCFSHIVGFLVQAILFLQLLLHQAAFSAHLASALIPTGCLITH